MATDIQRLERALVNADRAGDTEAARTLARELRQHRRPPSAGDRVLTSVPARFLRGAAIDPVDGLAETAPYVLGQVTSLGGFAPNPASEWLFDESRRVREMNAEREADYQGARSRAGQDGTDFARGAGGVAGGVALGAALPFAAPVTTMGRAAFGAGMGTAGALASPVREADDGEFLRQKAGQVLTGATVGAVAAPVMGKIVDAVGPWVDRAIARGRVAHMNDRLLNEHLRFELGKKGIDFADLDARVRERLTAEVGEALRKGRRLDPAAIARKADFEAMGLKGTKGQITRDPQQWTREFNLRQIDGAGRPLVDQLQGIRAASGQRLENYGGAAPGSANDRGAAVIGALQRADEPVKARVDSAYQAARAAAGRDARLQPFQFAEMANRAIDEGNLGAVLPNEVRAMMNRVARGEVPLTVDVASQMQSVLSAQSRMLRQAGNHEGALAVDHVSRALRNTDMEAGAPAAAREAFNAAKSLANARFQTQKAVPAYKAALDAARDPLKFPAEKFIDQYVVRGSQDAVHNLSKVLPEDGAQAVREHLVKHLQDAAFGSNASGGAPFAVERYMRALNRIGREKLRMFMPADVVDDLFRIGRVNAWATQAPVGAVPNRSGSGGMLVNAGREFLGTLSRIPGIRIGTDFVRNVGNRNAVTDALSSEISAESIPVLTPALRNLIGAAPLGLGLSQ